MSDIRQKSLKKNALFSSIKSVMNIIFPIISFPYASRILLPEGIGSVNVANSIIEYFLLIADLGIGTYAAREAARIRDNKYELSKLTREILFFNFITTTIAYLLLIISLLFINRLSDYRLLLIICSTKILFSTIGIGWLYTAQEDYGYITIRHIAFQIISLILLFTLVKSKEDYLIYAGIGVFSNIQIDAKPERNGFNPQTKEPMILPAQDAFNRPTFRFRPALKTEMKEETLGKVF